MIHDRQAAALGLQPAQHLEQITAAQPRQIQPNQRVNRGGELVEQGSHWCGSTLFALEHAYDLIGGDGVMSREIALIS